MSLKSCITNVLQRPELQFPLAFPLLLNSFMTEVSSYRNQPIILLCKSMDWPLYNRSFRHERFKWKDNFTRLEHP